MGFRQTQVSLPVSFSFICTSKKGKLLQFVFYGIVVSMVGTLEYKLAKYLDILIKPHIQDILYLLKSTDDFIELVKRFPCTGYNSYHIVNFDVASLFTNVQVSETIELIINLLYSDGNSYSISFDKDIFRQLMFMANQGSFMY